MEGQPVPVQTMKRLPSYYTFLKSLSGQEEFISATAIAKGLCLNDVQVRKDLAAVSSSGRPKIGYPVERLLLDIERYVGRRQIHSAVLVGIGDLGRAVLSYEGFIKQGIDIAAAFDGDPEIAGRCICGKQVLSWEKLPLICQTMNIRIGIIAVPDEAAQEICDRLVLNGVKRILNLTSASLRETPEVTIVTLEIKASLEALIIGETRNESN